MSLHKLTLQKLKKKCQEKLYRSIEEVIELQNAQTYLPAFTQTLKFENDYSKKMFIFNSKFILLELGDEKETSKSEATVSGEESETKKNRLTFKINESLQGNVTGKIVNHKLYQKSKCVEDYERLVAEVPMFIKSNPLIDVISYMEGKYDFYSNIPSVFSMLTNKKINDVNNNAYLEVLCAYFLNLLQEKKKCSLFPHFYGAFNGIAKNYVHDISEDYPHIRNCPWFEEKHETLKYEILRNNNLEDYQALSFKNIEKIDYFVERDLQYKKTKEEEMNGSKLEFSTENEVWESQNELETVDWDVVTNSTELLESSMNLEVLEIDNLDDIDMERSDTGRSDTGRSNTGRSDTDNEVDKSEEDSESGWSSLSSEGSCIFSETFLKIENFPVQILAMERLETTLTELAKQNLNLDDWKSILFEICFGLAVAQKNLGFIHNDLHSDNIMFKKCKLEYKYYEYQNKFYRVPTHSRETKVIDFARGILKVGKKTYFSDVFKNEGDAGGQYQYLNTQKKKKLNYHFDLARLATTIREFTENNSELQEIDKLLVSWCLNKEGDSFLEMDDNFSLYVEIASTANNSLPREQLEHNLFQSFIVARDSMPVTQDIYHY